MDPQALLADLDPAQVAAVTTPSRLVAVIAGAGSGKTRVLTRRIAYRVATGSADAAHTLALTFTREAAGELRRRLRTLGMRDHVEAGTFHAVALGLLRQRWADTDRPAPTVVGDRDRLLREVSGRTPIMAVSGEADWLAATGLGPDRYAAAARAAGRRPTVPIHRVAEILHALAVLKRRRGVVDLDDLLLLATRELASDRGFAEVTRWRFRHLLVDEAQDLNPVQHRMLQQLRGDEDDLYLVGDPAQAIYGFNGADPSLLIDVADRLPGVEVVRLPTNHRCTPSIVAAGAHVLRAGDQPTDAVASRTDGEPVELFGSADADGESGAVADVVAGCDAAMVRTGAVAVLARTHAQLSIVATELARRGIAVRQRGPARGTPLDAAVTAATRLPSPSRLRAWAHDTLGSAEGDADEVDEHAVAECRVAAAVLDFLREQPRGDGSALRSWLATTDAFRAGDDAGGVELLTFHAAKGREWHTVVVTGVETGLVPLRSASTIAARAEEARLLYVAMTRASDRLVVTWAERRGGYGRRPSPLIGGLPVGASTPAAPPTQLTGHRPSAGPLDALRAWRAGAARATGALPEHVCSDQALTAIASARPTTADELAEVSGLGPLTAARLLAPIRAALDHHDSHRDLVPDLAGSRDENR